MKELSDEELQEMIEKKIAASNSGQYSAEDVNTRAYSVLFEVLAKEPPIPMTHNFAEKVTASLRARKNHLADIKLWIVMGLFIALFMLAGVLYLASNNTLNGPLFILSVIKYKWAIFFGLISVFVIQYLDKTLIAAERAGV